jgi:hypothetical protein
MIGAARKVGHRQSATASPIDILRERAEARCLLVANGLMSLHDAVDQLQETAVAQGLAARHGQDAVQWILNESFSRWRL